MDQESLSSNQLDRLRNIFDRALDIGNTEERAAYVATECDGNDALLAEIEALLAAETSSPDTFLLAATPVLPDLSKIPPTESAGSILGPYTLLDKLGEGAFGVVWQAKQAEPVQREVALKIIKPGMDSEEVVARFEAERQALALMDHPSIAQVYDAGTTELGRPYFVMELVRGCPIAEYCDARRVPLAGRLKLFIEVCRAVQHAHQKGVIHRDLKPSNILVVEHEGQALPKVIDFGIAKAIDQELASRTLHTRENQFIGTPQYMSPEQTGVSGADVDTRTDIYALGVVLYELLTGVTPLTCDELKTGGWGEMERLIREVDPPKPSQRVATHNANQTALLVRTHSQDAFKITRNLRGDLDWITMRALEKDRDRRYGSASDFAHDLERYLANEPVSAGPPTFTYRTKKFIRRNRAAAVSIATIMIILFAAVAVSSWQAFVATKARHYAEEERRKSERSLLMIGDAHQSATDLAVVLLLELQSSHPADPRPIEVRARELVDLYFQDRENEVMGDEEESLHLRAVLLDSRGYLARGLGEIDRARKYYEEARRIREDLLERSPAKALYLHNVAVSFDNLGDLHIKGSEGASHAVPHYDDALEDYQRGLEFAMALDGLPDALPYWRHDVAVSHFKIGGTLQEKGDEIGALEALNEGYAITSGLLVDDPDYPKWQLLLARFCLLLGRQYSSDPDRDATAIRFLEEGITTVEGMKGAGSKDAAGVLELLKQEIMEITGEESE